MRTALVAAVGLVLGVVGPAAALPARYGGTLVVGLNNGDPDSLDPSLFRNLSAVEIANTFCERLYVFNGRAQVVPRLAAALPAISKDKLTYTIRLRKGILFNDGTPFDAQAVATTIMRGKTLPGSAKASDFSAISSVTAPNASTVVIHLSSRFSPLTSILATSDGMIMSQAQLAKLGSDFGSDPICVGPFAFDHWDHGLDVTVVKSHYYYAQDAVHLDKIVFTDATSPPAALAALQAGDLQVIDSVPSSELSTIRQSPSLSEIHRAALGYTAVVINIGNKNGVGNLPYQNVGSPLATSPKLRQAFEEAIDRKAWLALSGGTDEPGCTPLAPQSPYYVAIPCTPFDPADAKKLVAASATPNPTVHLIASGAFAEFIQAEEAAVGINVVLDPEPGATAQADKLAGNFDAELQATPNGTVPDRIIYGPLATSGSSNYSGYANPRLDAILANSRKATSATALKTLYRAAEKIVQADRPIIYLEHPSTDTAFSSSVSGVELNSDVQLLVAFAQYR